MKNRYFGGNRTSWWRRLNINPCKKQSPTGTGVQPQKEIFKQRVKEELTPQEVGKLEQITTSYHEEGRVEGKVEGRVEGAQTKALEVAKNLLAMGMDTEKIQQATGLSKEEVEKLVH